MRRSYYVYSIKKNNLEYRIGPNRGPGQGKSVLGNRVSQRQNCPLNYACFGASFFTPAYTRKSKSILYPMTQSLFFTRWGQFLAPNTSKPRKAPFQLALPDRIVLDPRKSAVADLPFADEANLRVQEKQRRMHAPQSGRIFLIENHGRPGKQDRNLPHPLAQITVDSDGARRPSA